MGVVADFEMRVKTQEADAALKGTTVNAEAAIKSLQKMGLAGDALERGLKGMGISAEAAKQAMAGVASGASTAATGIEAAEAKTKTFSAALGPAGSSLGRFRFGLISLTDQALGTNRAIGSMATGLLQFAGGGTIVTGLAVGLIGTVKLYDLFTASLRRARDEADGLIKSLANLGRSRTEELQSQLAKAQADAAVLERNLGANLNRQLQEKSALGFSPASIIDSFTGDTKKDVKRLMELKDTITRIQAEIGRTGKNERDRAQQEEIANLAVLGGIRSKDLAVRERSLALVEAAAKVERDITKTVAERANAQQTIGTLTSPGKNFANQSARQADAAQKAYDALQKEMAAFWKHANEAFDQAVQHDSNRLQVAMDISRKIIRDYQNELQFTLDPAGRLKLTQEIGIETERLRKYGAELEGVEKSAQRAREAARKAEQDFNRTLREGVNAVTAGLDKIDPVTGKPLNRPELPWETTARQVTQQEQLTRVIQRGAFAAADMAKQMGLFGERTVASIKNLVTLGSSVSGLTGAIKTANATPSFGNQIAVASAGLQVFGAVGSIIGGLAADTPAQQAQRKAVLDNTQAIRDLATHIIEINLTGRQQAQGAGALSAFGRGPSGALVLTGGGLIAGDFTAELTAAAQSVGLSFADLVDIAKGLHITLDGTAAATKAFATALKIAAPGTLYTANFAGQQQQLRDTFAIQGITDPDKQLLATAALLAENSPGIAGVLARYDLSTTAGRQSALVGIRAYYAAVAAGGFKAQSLGGLSSGDFISGIQSLTDLLNQSIGANPNAPSTSLSYRSSITETTALRIDSLLGTSNAYLRSIDANIAAMAGGRAVSGAASLGAVSVTVNIDGSGDPYATGSAVVDSINQSLGSILARKAAMNGNAVMT